MKLFSIFLLAILTNRPRYPKFVNVRPENLNWSYYEAKGPVSPGIHAATTGSTFIMLPIDKAHPKYRVAVYFMTDSSWVDKIILKRLTADSLKWLFNHELNHYKIEIIFAKKFLLYLQPPYHSTDYYSRLLDAINKECREANDSYDFETSNGVDSTGQIFWNNKIKIGLDSYKNIELTWGVAFPPGY